MAVRADQVRKARGLTPAVLLGGTVVLLALPSAVLAFANRIDALPQLIADPNESLFQAATVDPRLARSITVRALAKGKAFQFTPAATPSRLERSVTVAVRLDTGRLGARGSQELRDAAATGGGLRIAPTAYSLGATRGYKSFAQSIGVTADGRRLDMPDLASFTPSPGAKGTPSRFSPRIALEDRDQAGRSPRTFEGQDEARVDVGGSYRLTRNLNVTAGVRYEQERDRLKPITDGKQDSQAVYVGTQFKF